MSGRFTGRACLVTGSTGMGAAAARALAADGGNVFVVSRTAEHARELADSIVAGGARADWRAADLTQEEAVASALGACVERFGRLDCVFNVAGISGRRFGDGPVHELTADGWETVMANNIRSVFLVTRVAVRQMLAQGGGGAIVNMSSVLAEHPSAPLFSTHAYAASKGAINSFSIAVAAHYARDGIRVNVIAPGLVATPMSRRAQEDAQILAYLRERQPLAGGPIAAEDVVGTVLYLLSDDSRMVTGQIVAVDAGWKVSEG
ncbi:MAG: SDR family oxidoreductase [Chloroflexota bacterium]|nr:SDR family oxidoreductase [Chloroflexota bacterium]